MSARTDRIKQFMSLAEQALNTAQANLDAGDFRASVNRAYYAVFYAASAMLLTKGLERRKHSGVISAFREHFVRPGLVEAEFSNVYGETLTIREDADYAVEILIDLDMAETALRQARRFVERMCQHLVQESFWDEPFQ
jgi:uncharacterized protein (UPF0332 family)